MLEHIIIGDISPRIQFSGDGSTTVFAYPFPIFADSDLEVYLDSTLQSAGYTISGAGNSAGGNVTFDTAPPVDTTLTLRRYLVVERTTDFQESGEFRAKVINDELDREIAMIQQISDDLDRTLHLTASDETVALELPDKSTRSGRVLAFDAGGSPVASTNTLSSIEDSITTSAASAAAAATSEANAATSETNSASSETAAANAAQAAQDAADSVAWQVERVNFAASPVTAVVGRMYVVDTSGGNVVINLPSIAAAGEPTSIAIRKETGDSNTVTANRNGSDTIEGAASYPIENVSSHSLHADIDVTPDNWAAVNMGGKLANPVVDALTDGVDYQAGVDNSVTASQTLDVENAMWVTFDGVVQHHDTWSVSGSTVTFTATIGASVASIELHYFETIEIGVPADSSVTSAKLSGAMFAAPLADNDGSFAMSAGNDFLWTPTAADVLDFTTRTSGQRGMVLLDNAGGHAITFGSNIYGPDTAAVDLSEIGIREISYWCTNGTDVRLSYGPIEVAV